LLCLQVSDFRDGKKATKPEAIKVPVAEELDRFCSPVHANTDVDAKTQLKLLQTHTKSQNHRITEC